MSIEEAVHDLPAGPHLTPAEATFRWLAQPYAFLDQCVAELGDTFSLEFNRFGTHVLVSHPDDVQAVFSADRDTLHAGRGNALLEPILGRHSLLLADGEQHAMQRALLQPAFRSELLPRYARVVAAATRRWTLEWEATKSVNLQSTSLEISKEVILRIIFGLDDNDLERFSALVHDLMQLVATNATFEAASTDVRLLQRFHAARAALDAALRQQIGARRHRGSNQGNDVLSLLIRARHPDGGSLSDTEISDQLITMVLAGHETTASSVTWALLCLHGERRTLERLVAEIDAAQRSVADEQLAQLPYLQAVTMETLRLRPVIPVVSRQVQRPLRLRQHTLPPGVFVTPCAYLAQRRPAVFAEPTAFRPERFLDRRYSPYSYFPFGGGARRCIGMSFALLEIQIVLGVLLRRFRFEPLSPEPARPVRRAVTIVAAGGGRMLVAPRQAA